jgi:hypothetical protein
MSEIVNGRRSLAIECHELDLTDEPSNRVRE